MIIIVLTGVGVMLICAVLLVVARVIKGATGGWEEDDRG